MARHCREEFAALLERTKDKRREIALFTRGTHVWKVTILDEDLYITDEEED